MTLPSYVGRYEVRREIARGGFAVVVQAWDEELQSLVAIKILLRELADKEDIQRRFVDEARLLRRIRSPSVITVHDVGRLNDGLPYFVMDFADCGTLAARLERGPAAQVADQPSIMALADAVADGLSAIHEAGVVHRDIKPANILFQSARRGSTEHDEADSADRPAQPALIGSGERILVGDLGIAKDVLKHGHFVTLIGGTPLYRAPEQGDDDAEITPAADVYSATALLWHVLTGHRPPEARDIRNRMSVLPMAWHEVIEQGMALDPSDRFASMAIWRAAVHDALAQEAAEEPNARLTEVVVPTTAECPYKGLAAYQPDDAPRFFGREALIDDLVRRLQMQRVLVVGGPSGSGKSSVVRAGLIPALSSGALLGSESWRVVLFTPGRDPLGELYFQVKTALGAAAPAVSLEDLLARPTLARHLVGSGSSQPTLLLCIDQFEELFTLAPPGQLTQFISALSAMTDPADSSVRIAIVVRADFYAACAEVPWLAERITDNQVLVGPMSNSELRRAISEPARRVGLYLERGLVDAVIAEAGHEAGSLPLVAHALMETWLRRQGNALTLEGFRAAGGVAGAISQTADATYEQRFNSVEQAATRRLFLRLVTPGESTPDTRRVVARSEIDRDSQPDVMHRVIDCPTRPCFAHGRDCGAGSRTPATICEPVSASVMRRRNGAMRKWIPICYIAGRLCSRLSSGSESIRISLASANALFSMRRSRPRPAPKRRPPTRSADPVAYVESRSRDCRFLRSARPLHRSRRSWRFEKRSKMRTAPSWRPQKRANGSPAHSGRPPAAWSTAIRCSRCRWRLRP
jgi:serine/threonine protein kinase